MDRQEALPGAEGIRDEALEEAGKDLVNAKHAKAVAKEKYRAAYTDVKALMIERDLDTYPMLDCKGVTLRKKQKDAEIVIEETDAAAVK